MRKPSSVFRIFALFSLGSGILLFVVATSMDAPVEPDTSPVYRDLQSAMPAAQYYPLIKDTLWQGFDSLDNFLGLIYRVFPRGYKGSIPVMVGVDSTGTITGLLIPRSELKETPGLGMKVADSSFRARFTGRTAADLKLKKDGGEIDAISGATVSSRAVCNGIRNGYEKYSSCMIHPDEKSRVLPGAYNFTTVIKDTLWLAGRGPDTAGIVIQGFVMGYLDTIKFMVGVDRRGKITGVEILASSETEGIGERIREKEFLTKFKDSIPDAISGATMSSRPLIDAIRSCVDRFKEYYRP
jgi:Na+-translocating ferredoxin:NAD+ oxidoreductase RnfG subunit